MALMVYSRAPSVAQYFAKAHRRTVENSARAAAWIAFIFGVVHSRSVREVDGHDLDGRTGTSPDRLKVGMATVSAPPPGGSGYTGGSQAVRNSMSAPIIAAQLSVLRG